MCEARYRELMYKVVDGTASEAEVAELQEHVAGCCRCAALFERIKLLDSLLREGMRSRRYEGGWERLAGRIRARRVLRYAGAAAVSAAAALLLAFSLILPSTAPHPVAFAEGDLIVEHNGEAVKVKAGDRIPEGAVVRNSSGRVGGVKTPKGSRILLGVGSAFRLVDHKLWRLRLLSGQIRAKVNDEPFSVVCNGVEVRVCGTDFVVRRYGAGVEVEVYEGSVSFESAGKAVLLKAGDTGFARWGAPPFVSVRSSAVKRPSVPLEKPLPQKPVSLSPQGKPPAPLDLPVPRPGEPDNR
ncbi:MAG: hypothetical protein DRP63_07160 [Planctomycetota bacterium]|nr:MAG: hypothetical protein DRP63_07160 [Planctomycetota bacterium]